MRRPFRWQCFFSFGRAGGEIKLDRL